MRQHPVTNWMMEWDVATFIEALEEAFPLNAGDGHLGHGQRWLDVAYRVQSTVQVLNHDMASLRGTLVAEVNNAMHSIGEVPAENLQKILKLLRRCFPCYDQQGIPTSVRIETRLGPSRYADFRVGEGPSAKHLTDEMDRDLECILVTPVRLIAPTPSHI